MCIRDSYKAWSVVDRGEEPVQAVKGVRVPKPTVNVGTPIRSSPAVEPQSWEAREASVATFGNEVAISEDGASYGLMLVCQLPWAPWGTRRSWGPGWGTGRMGPAKDKMIPMPRVIKSQGNSRRAQEGHKEASEGWG